MLGGMFAYQDAKENKPTYQQHPVTVVLTNFFCGSLTGLICYLGTGWIYKRKERKLQEAGNDKYYDEVARELQEKPMIPGLWTKAFSEMAGDDAKARALYIKYRVAQLAEESRQKHAAIRAADAKLYAAIEVAERQNLTRFHRIIHWIIGIFCGLLCLFSGLCGIICIIELFTEKDFNSDDLVGAIVAAIFSFFVAFVSGLGFRHCQRNV
jgi:hypothetical protein